MNEITEKLMKSIPRIIKENKSLLDKLAEYDKKVKHKGNYND